METPDNETIRFDFPGLGDRELPLILALMPVLSHKATDATNFESASFDIPVGSGPYRIATVDPGQKLILKRNPDYWAKDLASQRGLFNFDTVEIDYYRDPDKPFRGISYRPRRFPHRNRSFALDNGIRFSRRACAS